MSREEEINAIKADLITKKPEDSVALGQSTNLGLRFNKGKPRWSLMDFKAMEPMIEVLGFGAQKYDEHNWKKGLPVSEICDSLTRHLTAFLTGEDVDPESGLSHIGHMQCNLMFLSFMLQNKPNLDDRYKKSE